MNTVIIVGTVVTEIKKESNKCSFEIDYKGDTFPVEVYGSLINFCLDLEIGLVVKVVGTLKKCKSKEPECVIIIAEHIEKKWNKNLIL
jgi:hypothetical protein